MSKFKLVHPSGHLLVPLCNRPSSITPIKTLFFAFSRSKTVWSATDLRADRLESKVTSTIVKAKSVFVQKCLKCPRLQRCPRSRQWCPERRRFRSRCHCRHLHGRQRPQWRRTLAVDVAVHEWRAVCGFCALFCRRPTFAFWPCNKWSIKKSRKEDKNLINLF